MATELRSHCISATIPETTAVASHQRNGSCERHHDTIAGFVRTMGSVIKQTTGLVVEPEMRLFAWMARHASTLTNDCHIRSNGLTSHYMLKGEEARLRLATFGEVVMYKIDTDEPRSKCSPLQEKGIFVGIKEKNRSCILNCSFSI